MKFTSFAIAMLLAPCEAVKVSTEFPKLPSADSITKVAAKQLEEGKREVSRALHEVRSYTNRECDKTGKCHKVTNTYERGLRRDLKGFNRDVVRAFEEAGIDWKANVYDPKFITDLIEAEYNDFVTNFQKHRAQIAKTKLQPVLDKIQSEAKNAGLAELEAPVHGSARMTSTVRRRRQEPKCYRRAERKRCPRVKQEDMKCPGDCCHRGPKNDAESKAFNDYYQNRWRTQRNARAKCFASEGLAKEINRDMPDAKEMGNAIAHMIEEVAREVNSPREVQGIAHVIQQVNQVLTGEAKRLGVSHVVALPDPKDSSEKLAKMVQWVEKQSKTAEGKGEITKSMEELRYDVLQEAYQTEQQFKQMSGGAKDITPATVVKALDGAKAGIRDRDLKEAAREINKLGGNATPGEVKAFITESIGTLKKIVLDKNAPRKMEREGEQIVRAAEHRVGI